MPSARSSRSSGCTSANKLNATGYSLSERSKKHTWLRRVGGTSASTSSASCPCGSMRRTPSPRAMSCAMIDRKSVDLPMPVLPRTAIWRRRSCSVSETGLPAASIPSRVCSISGRAPEREVMRLGGDRVLAYCGSSLMQVLCQTCNVHIPTRAVLICRGRSKTISRLARCARHRNTRMWTRHPSLAPTPR